MRGILLSTQQTTRDEGYSPTPTETWQPNLQFTKKGACCDFSLNHLNSLQPHLSACFGGIVGGS
jgi:hypothetical protein